MNDPLGDDHLKIKQIQAEAEAKVEEAARLARIEAIKEKHLMLSQVHNLKGRVLAEAEVEAQEIKKQAQIETQAEIARIKEELVQQAKERVKQLVQERAKQLDEETIMPLREVLVTFVHARFPTLTELAQAKAAQVDTPQVLSYLLKQIAASCDENEVRIFLRPRAE